MKAIVHTDDFNGYSTFFMMSKSDSRYSKYTHVSDVVEYAKGIAQTADDSMWVIFADMSAKKS